MPISVANEELCPSLASSSFPPFTPLFSISFCLDLSHSLTCYHTHSLTFRANMHITILLSHTQTHAHAHSFSHTRICTLSLSFTPFLTGFLFQFATRVFSCCTRFVFCPTLIFFLRESLECKTLALGWCDTGAILCDTGAILV